MERCYSREQQKYESVEQGMAKATEGGETFVVGEFCCALTYTQFQVCKLRQHVEIVKKKLEAIEEENQGVRKITKYLSYVLKNFSSIEQELKEKKKSQNLAPKNDGKNVNLPTALAKPS